MVVSLLKMTVAVAGLAEVAGTNANMGGKDTEADEAGAVASFGNLAFDGMDFEAKIG